MRSLVAALFLLNGCATVGDRQFAGIEWQAVNINGVPVAAATPVTLRFDGDGRVTGAGPCNSYFAGYRMLSRERIGFSGLGSTERACAPAIMDEERRYLSIIENAQGYSFYGDGGLSLIAGDGRAIRYRRN